MKGISKQIERLGIGEQVTLHETKRENIYTIARRKGITVRAEKMLDGFLVTRTGTLGERPETVTRQAERITTEKHIETVIDDFDFGA